MGGSQKHTHPEPCRLTLVCRLSCTPTPASSLTDTLGRVSSSIFSLERRWGELLSLHTPEPGWIPTGIFLVRFMLSNVTPTSQLETLPYLATSSPSLVSKCDTAPHPEQTPQEFLSQVSVQLVLAIPVWSTHS